MGVARAVPVIEVRSQAPAVGRRKDDSRVDNGEDHRDNHTDGSIVARSMAIVTAT